MPDYLRQSIESQNSGRGARIRTGGLKYPKLARYQLRYTPWPGS